MKKSAINRVSTLNSKGPKNPLAKLQLSDSHSSFEDQADYSQGHLSPKSLQHSKTFKGSTTPSSHIPRSPTNFPSSSRFSLPNNSLLETDALENYNIHSDLGRGTHSTVKLATQKATGQKFAIKIFNKKDLNDPALRKSVMREIKILKKIDHQNIVKYFEDIQGKNYLYIVMEYVKGIALSDHLIGKALKRLQENEACEVFVQIITALDYLHSKSITHRDIRLENILLDLEFNAKLIDFGVSTCFSNTKKLLVYSGGEAYMAPEIVKKEESFGPPVDIWAAGVVLFALVTGTLPFNSKSKKRILDKVKTAEYEIPEYLSLECKELIRLMLNPSAESRPCARDILCHPWARLNLRVRN